MGSPKSKLDQPVKMTTISQYPPIVRYDEIDVLPDVIP